ncbi:MAG: sugar phosphate isomerase/epimerase [Deltaproteobacteria bacterium]|nr:sugar phosphate isomerase/epimerase [Deltaproteobacteria bacterium]
MPCYVNLPLSWVSEQPLWVDWFVNGGIAPELGLDGGSLGLPDAWHQSLAARLRGAGVPCAVHLPFLGTDPCDLDEAKVRKARADLRRGADIARIYGAVHMIGHPYYRPRKPGREGDAITGRWMELSLAAWPELPERANARLFLENTYERSPEALAALAARLCPAGTKDGETQPAIGLCFDAGHWQTFAGCRTEAELDVWLDAFADFALHLHLHDNDGSFDQHLGLGEGRVPFGALFARLRAKGKAVSATLEPHDVDAFTKSIAWLEAHGAEAAQIGWRAPRMGALPLAEIEKNLAK